MGRHENPVERTGPISDHAIQLRVLRQHAGLTLRQLADLTGLSAGTLSVAQGGRELPTWEVTSRFVKACGADVEEWRRRWEAAASFARLPRSMHAVGVDQLPPVRWRSSEAKAMLRRLAGPAPLPVTAESPAQFTECLRRVKIWAGDPPIRVLASRVDLPPSTLHDVLRRKNGTLPNIENVCAFLSACGIEDQNVIREWVFTWRRLKYEETEARRKKAPRRLISA